MSVKIEEIKVGERLRFTEGDLVDEGYVERIAYDEDIIYIRVPTAQGEDTIGVDPDEPGLERI